MVNKAYKILTPRLQLRCYEQNDAEKLKISVDESLVHLSEWMPWAAFEPQSIPQKVELIKKFRTNFLNDLDYTYGIFDLDNQHLIGGCGLHRRSTNNILEIGYWINVNQINNGFAQEAAYAMAYAGFQHIGIEKIEIRCDFLNFNSANVPLKINFNHEYDYRIIEKDDLGIRKKHKVFVMFKEEFKLINKFHPLTIFDINDNKIC